jgi:hypothetical protein
MLSPSRQRLAAGLAAVKLLPVLLLLLPSAKPCDIP